MVNIKNGVFRSTHPAAQSRGCGITLTETILLFESSWRSQTIQFNINQKDQLLAKITFFRLSQKKKFFIGIF